MTIIVATDENQAIGKDNQLLWYLPDDLKHFKALTQNHAIIMGRKTYESLGKPLPNRINIVVSKNKKYPVPENVLLCESLHEAISTAKEKDTNPYIIGGGKIYEQALNMANKLEITIVHTKMRDADTYFPSINLTEWKVTNEMFHPKDEKHQFDFTFLTYTRI